MSRLEIHQIPVLSDNYVYLAHCPETGATGVVDPAVTGPVLEAAAQKGWQITHILNTHHHGDHTGGNIGIKNATGCTIVGPGADRDRIPGIDIGIDEGDICTLGNAEAKVFFCPGHTRGHIAFWFADSDALFCGDTMFAMGCGRLFEGTPAQMWTSLQKFMKLPGETRIYCAHEYTQANGRFALSVEPDNRDLIQRITEVDAKREQDIPTVPSTLAEERATNPFLRPESPLLQKTIGMVGGDPVAVFAETRLRKDNF
ncbi:MAG: hydroxyacylglutathione hydrolase [Rhodospirillales bacterium]|nr:hydroxyacylglutathione hydrolase [Rhodospirillales bacterium]